MISVQVEDDLEAILRESEQPVSAAVREMLVLELYRRGTISSGKAGELLGMPRFDFVKFAGKLGIPFFRMDEHEWQAELARAQQV